ncbi:MAG: quinolinate synthase [Omnitrophica bacterium RIFCSPHIGHO2_02_FULL_46_11]|nr:MAG: quinolinate synthase [Omnitrophica bacterium RIFCSPHIGHO2_02_FULL_46_11]OGW87742.1 MAG: quinolinate synthase [Omnitrophica bacterium RIFCSPLOWO2_01_FULL_45_10b]
MPAQVYNSIEEEIKALKRKRGAVILAHNYQVGEIQDIADFTGDSLGLAQEAQKMNAPVIVFSGVLFMAETVSILCPDKTVLVPDLEAGCSLAAMIRPEDVRKWKAEHPKGIVVAYVNTTAEVKAEADYCCTSSNAVKVVSAIPEDREILFVPDFYLGSFVQMKTGRKNITIWKGYCHVHVMIKSERLAQLKKEHSQAELLMHPECGCLTKSMEFADQILSTEGMVKYVRQSKAPEFIVATETGILHKMQKENPGKNFIPATNQAVCNYMKQNTLEKIVLSLERMQYEIKVPEPIRKQALVPIQRMLEISQ